MENKIYIVNVRHHYSEEYGEYNYSKCTTLYVSFDKDKVLYVMEKLKNILLHYKHNRDCKCELQLNELELDTLNNEVYKYTKFYDSNEYEYYSEIKKQINRDDFDNRSDYWDVIDKLAEGLLKKDTMGIVLERFCEKNYIKLEGNKID